MASIESRGRGKRVTFTDGTSASFASHQSHPYYPSGSEEAAAAPHPLVGKYVTLEDKRYKITDVQPSKWGAGKVDFTLKNRAGQSSHISGMTESWARQNEPPPEIKPSQVRDVADYFDRRGDGEWLLKGAHRFTDYRGNNHAQAARALLEHFADTPANRHHGGTITTDPATMRRIILHAFS